MSRSLAITIYACTAVFFALFFVFPIWHTVQEAFVTADGTITFAYFEELFRNPIYVEGLVNSFYMGLFTTILALVIALPLALISNTWQFRGKEILNALILVPLILPPFVGALGVRQFLGQHFRAALGELIAAEKGDGTTAAVKSVLLAEGHE